MAIEEPSYEVLEQADEYEVRRYAPYLVVEVDVEGDFGEAGNKAFRLLSGYIFGDNQTEEKMSMTAPVESRPKEEGIRMSMTAPVTSTASASDEYTYAFVMERKYTLDTLPQPRARGTGGPGDGSASIFGALDRRKLPQERSQADGGFVC
jgi:hypothetical protein